MTRHYLKNGICIYCGAIFMYQQGDDGYYVEHIHIEPGQSYPFITKEENRDDRIKSCSVPKRKKDGRKTI